MPNKPSKKLVPWRELSGLRHLAGTVSYEATFDFESDRSSDALEWEIYLGEVYEVAEVWLNDQSLGVAWKSPFQVDATTAIHQGENVLRIEVSNLLNNNLKSSPSYQRRSGLLGPVYVAPVYRAIIQHVPN